ncbi:MAG: dTDP-4-dehydrorhamnose 3,5-epimerase family protein, partial [Alphaproteobacteria bacterium]|nr:dTDP-4-dehydrorhamnose 3,5-epimerase family protein [Alphaproteobacteria bacterium]
YAMAAPYAAASACGARYDDPAFGIDWPAAPAVIAARDLAWPAFAR